MTIDASAAVLSAVSVELTALGEMVDSLAGIVSEHVRQSTGEARALALKEAQTIDHLQQRLQALSQVAGAISAGADVDATLKAVSLADLSHRLQAAVSTTGSAPAVQPEAGELLLFE